MAATGRKSAPATREVKNLEDDSEEEEEVTTNHEDENEQEEEEDATTEESDDQQESNESNGQTSEEVELEAAEMISEEEIKHAIALASDAVSKKFGWNKNSNASTSTSNPLSDIIPGYVAPLSLDSSSLDQYKSANQIQRKEHMTASSSKSTSTLLVANHRPARNNHYKKTRPDATVIERNKTNAGSGWFNFEATPYTKDIEADIAVIRNRTYLDPKKFYKSSDFGKKGPASKMVQLGTVIEGSMESVFSNRLTKKQRRANVAEEIMGEVYGSRDDYVKKKYSKMQKEKIHLGKKRKAIQTGKSHYRKKTWK